ncbi:hypothetical protein [Shewanella dokdonensis]|uniref:Holin n=1 Tax=Shewanella dokdonensis TaxID=712036 RepID=A0ABX8DES5_9GAMM|nr:hypothetical protein [Shewanella dokdonensis]MCL1072988.1 hypothetical protein [Shewanella dokdonensis]QVK23098.1 hypothetical protein KHX94_18700 [Shewanella dokdonensis]
MEGLIQILAGSWSTPAMAVAVLVGIYKLWQEQSKTREAVTALLHDHDKRIAILESKE